ncbi:hypothetical protein G9F71_022235 [Clostridium sp. FP2]|uniref:hypothetical protein n=1 Tax=Clostridium sp. FP2 TaxID=2724481 RepID=UPI0013E90B08|nr:hypothetical protein [Clostridium sp. FP2]MBZ9625552.1 hypothetical protein [Clostridium sp. FP2]
MRILVGQPIHEKNADQLEKEIKNNPNIDMIIYPEGYLVDEDALLATCEIAKKYNKTIITGYKSKDKDRGLIINSLGEKVLDRAKTPEDEELYSPSVVDNDGLRIGYLLCREILKGGEGLKIVGGRLDFIAHPIGVGMFSEKQFEEWVEVAKNIAITYKTTIIGTSHADGSYRNCGVSISISYCIDASGEIVFISKADKRTRIIDLLTKKVETID